MKGIQKLLILSCALLSFWSFGQEDSLAGFNEDSVRRTFRRLPKNEIPGLMGYKKAEYIGKKYGTWEQPIPQPQAVIIVPPPGEDPMPCDRNPGFENGTFSGWEGSIGTTSSCCNTNGFVTGRHTIYAAGSGNDEIGGFPKVLPGSQYSVRLGNPERGALAESMSYVFDVTAENSSFTYYYAVVLEDPNHSQHEQPKVLFQMLDENDLLIPCSEFRVSAGSGIAGFVDGPGVTIYRPWSGNTVDLSAYIGQQVKLKFSTYDCTQGGHYGYAYIDGDCLPSAIDMDGPPCAEIEKFFSSPIVGTYENESYSWNFGDGSAPVTTPTALHTYMNPGTYTVTLTITYLGLTSCNVISITRTIEVTDPCPIPCDDCVTPIVPSKGDYILSAWVREAAPDRTKTSYNYPKISVSSASGVLGSFTGTGPIIDGWQRVEGVFNLPVDNTISVKLECLGGDCYFDDIRIFPFDGSMMSYVYDPLTLRLMAELDERNYAKFYEYDEEGKLIRVEKETVTGIQTIQENRQSTPGDGQ